MQGTDQAGPTCEIMRDRSPWTQSASQSIEHRKAYRSTLIPLFHGVMMIRSLITRLSRLLRSFFMASPKHDVNQRFRDKLSNRLQTCILTTRDQPCFSKHQISSGSNSWTSVSKYVTLGAGLMKPMPTSDLSMDKRQQSEACSHFKKPNSAHNAPCFFWNN